MLIKCWSKVYALACVYFWQRKSLFVEFFIIFASFWQFSAVFCGNWSILAGVAILLSILAEHEKPDGPDWTHSKEFSTESWRGGGFWKEIDGGDF